jgi:hypothetical protein
MKDPLDLRLLCGVLEGLADDGVSCLDVYSKDILMVHIYTYIYSYIYTYVYIYM